MYPFWSLKLIRVPCVARNGTFSLSLSNTNTVSLTNYTDNTFKRMSYLYTFKGFNNCMFYKDLHTL